LRKVVAHFSDARGSRDLEVHQEAVSLAAQGGPAAKALHKALDQRHEATIQQFAKARGANALGALWDEARRRGIMVHICATDKRGPDTVLVIDL
jgi:hypothetical protein